MQENQLFEYAVIRLVPRVEREEFINVGIILFCAKQKFLKSMVELNEQRIKCLCPEIDMDMLKAHISTFEIIGSGSNTGGPIARLSIAERFRWLTATRSTIVQTSKVHPGFSGDPGKTLTQLFNQLVV